MSSDSQRKVMCILTAIMLALTYFVAGFAVCAGIPGITEQLSMRFSSAELSPFSQSQLTDLASATRDYTVGSHDLDKLVSEISKANSEAGTPYGDASKEELLADVPDEYTLDEAAISHLDDVNEVTSKFFMPILGIAALAGFCIMATYRLFGSEPIARALIWSGTGILIAFAVMGVWGMFGFSGFFAGIHALFFKSGTWIFPVDSLLISMYPQAFWMGMGLVWLATSCLLAAIALVGGVIMLRRQKKKALDD